MATTNNRLSLTDPTGWIQMWASLLRGVVPEHLVQPINQGWFGTFINNNNSSAPQTEMDVVAQYSYGRQINKISDALALLIQERPSKTRKDGFSTFLKMKGEIDDLKVESLVARVEDVPNALKLLKARDKERYTRVREALREALYEKR